MERELNVLKGGRICGMMVVPLSDRILKCRNGARETHHIHSKSTQWVSFFFEIASFSLCSYLPFT